MDVVIRDGILRSVQLRIYEPPRFFEAMLRGRAYTEPPDITARICGICPVAYQMSACNAIEALCGVTVDGPLADLRRLLYCGEWIESHTPPHLPPPRPRLPRLRRGHRPRRRPSGRGAAWPRAEEDRQRAGRADRWSGHPSRQRPRRWLLPGADRAGAGPRSHPASSGPVTSRSTPSGGWPASSSPTTSGSASSSRSHIRASTRSRGADWSRRSASTSALRSSSDHVVEEHVEHSTALHARLVDRGEYLLGPLARFALNAHELSPVASDAATAAGLSAGERNPFRSIVVRGCRGAVRVRRGAPDHRRLPRARRGCRGGRGPRRDRLRLDRGTPRDAVASVRVRRRGHHHQRSDRPADLAEPGRASSATCSTSSSTTSTSTTASSAAVPSRSSAATTRASRARHTSST